MELIQSQPSIKHNQEEKEKAIIVNSPIEDKWEQKIFDKMTIRKSGYYPILNCT